MTLMVRVFSGQVTLTTDTIRATNVLAFAHFFGSLYRKGAGRRFLYQHKPDVLQLCISACLWCLKGKF